MFLSATYLPPRNQNIWNFWRGSDNLVYAQVIGNTTETGSTKPWADCNPWASKDGTCATCVTATNGFLGNCCSCKYPNIDKLVNFPNPQGTGTINVCEAYGIQID